MIALRNFLLVLASATLAGAQSAAEKELLSLEAKWYHAFTQSDAATMNLIEGEDMMIIIPELTPDRFAPLKKSRSFAKRSAEDKAKYQKIERSLDRTQVRFIGDVAIINAIQTAQLDGEKETAYYTSVWNAAAPGNW